jgi:hypothetical protein
MTDLERAADQMDLELFRIASGAQGIAEELGRKPSAHDWYEIAHAARSIRPMVRKYMTAKRRNETCEQ